MSDTHTPDRPRWKVGQTYTPKPRPLGYSGDYTSVVTDEPWPKEKVVATVRDLYVDQIGQYARLIAAAPDLLAALRMVCDSGVSLAAPIETAMLAAIAKAEGRG